MKQTPLAAALVSLLSAGCLTGPRPTAEALRRERNERAVVEGTVRDALGDPVPGILVYGMPRDEDVLWSPPAETDAAGRFRLLLIAPGEYGFLLSREAKTVITPDPRDPSRFHVVLKPRETRSGLELVFLREEREKVLAGESAGTSSFP
jgi:protocatechuate 3,4-dioxygenase beta subunit